MLPAQDFSVSFATAIYKSRSFSQSVYISNAQYFLSIGCQVNHKNLALYKIKQGIIEVFDFLGTTVTKKPQRNIYILLCLLYRELNFSLPSNCL